VNLYLPSTLRWTTMDGSQLALTQRGDYPVDSKIAMHLRASRSSRFTLRLRIPAWSLPAEPVIRINGERALAPIRNGFVSLQRVWNDGDRIELEIALPLRLEAIDKNHPNTVALVRGPLVLFAVADQPPALTKQQLLSAVQVPKQTTWRPFSDIGDAQYSTYLNLIS
jgi:uncharacterized protein